MNTKRGAFISELISEMFGGLPPYDPEQLRWPNGKPLRANRGVKAEKKFEGGDFAGYRAACEFARAEGYSMGPADESDPIALVKGVAHVAAWSALGSGEIMRTDGNMWVEDGGNYADGPVFVTLFA